MIDKKNKFVFVHTPKTAGSSITRALASHFSIPRKAYISHLGARFHQHLLAREIRQLAFRGRKGAVEFKHCFKFSFVRNPWDRVVSEMRWRKDPVPSEDLKKFLKKRFFRMPGLGKPPSSRRHICPQHHFLYNKKGNLMIDFLGRFENLHEDFSIVCDKLGVPPLDLPHIQKSKRKPYMEYYDDETREIVGQLYKKDIDIFGYKFGE